MSENEKKPWYSDMSPDENVRYEENVIRICNGVKQSNLSFEKASALIDVKDTGLRAAIIDDALKVLIAEIHFSGGKSLEDLAKILRLPVDRLTKARQEMLKDVEAAAIEKYKQEQGGIGNA